MANYVVTTRNKDGSLAERAYTANDRSDLFKQLAADGVNAVSIREGMASKKNQSRKAAGGSAPSKGRGLIAAAIVALGLGAAIWFLMPRGETPAAVKKGPKKSVKIAELQTNDNKRVPKKDAPVPVKAKKTIEKWMGHEIVSTKSVTNGNNIVITRIGKDGKIYKELKKNEPPPIFDNPVDQVLALMLTTPEGAMMPPVPPLGPNAGDIFADALKRPIEIKKTDSDEVKQIKRIVQSAREDMLAEISAGKTVNQVVEDYCTYVNENNKLRAAAMAEYRRILDDENDPQMAEEYRVKANAVLEKAGAVTIKHPDEIQSRRRRPTTNIQQ